MRTKILHIDCLHQKSSNYQLQRAAQKLHLPHWLILTLPVLSYKQVQLQQVTFTKHSNREFCLEADTCSPPATDGTKSEQ